MKKRIRRSLVTVLTICVMFSMLSLTAFAAPFTTPDLTMDGIQVIQGATAEIKFSIWFDKYKYTRYEVTLFGPSGEIVGTADNQVNNYGTYIKDVVITYDSTGDACGKYTANIYLEYYTLGAWREVPNNNDEIDFYIVKQDSNLNGLAIAKDGNYNYYKNGVIDKSYTGFSGPLNYHYVVNGTVDFNYNGVARRNGELVYVEDGEYHSAYSGIGKASDGTLYYFSHGEIDYDYEGNKTLDGEHYYVKNGIARKVCPGTGADHEYDNGTIIVNPTCTSAGERKIKCTGCDEYYTEKIPALGHKYNSEYVSVEPDCTTPGKKIIKCVNCNDSYSEVIPALGHNYDDGTITKIPTCTETGVKTYFCKNNATHKKDEVIPAIGHKDGEKDFICDVCGNPTCTKHREKTVKGYDATCINDGLSDGKICGICGYEIKEQKVLKATGVHVYENGYCTYCNKKDPNPFTDVADDAWYASPVLWAYSSDVTGGTSATTFGPDDSCTRAQVVTFLWAANGKPEPKSMDNPFEDVADDAWYLKPVLWAVEQGITTGISDTEFGPEQTCTRAQIATFLYAAAGKPEVKGGSTFGDVADAAWYAKPVIWAVENDVTSGIGDGKFGPNNTCTRAQVVTFLYKVYADK